MNADRLFENEQAAVDELVLVGGFTGGQAREAILVLLRAGFTIRPADATDRAIRRAQEAMADAQKSLDQMHERRAAFDRRAILRHLERFEAVYKDMAARS